MFTGIVRELGEVLALTTHPTREASLVVRGPLVAAGATPGDSVAVDGVCVTVTVVDSGASSFTVDVMGETLARTTLGGYRPGQQVDLEPAVRADQRLDGHIVQGHVDGTTVLRSLAPSGGWSVATFELPRALARYVAEKGSIALDGVSLTVAGVTDDDFTVGLIPETLRRTVLGAKQVGDRLNVEVDVIAKYLERLTARMEGVR